MSAENETSTEQVTVTLGDGSKRNGLLLSGNACRTTDPCGVKLVKLVIWGADGKTLLERVREPASNEQLAHDLAAMMRDWRAENEHRSETRRRVSQHPRDCGQVYMRQRGAANVFHRAYAQDAARSRNGERIGACGLLTGHVEILADDEVSHLPDSFFCRACFPTGNPRRAA